MRDLESGSDTVIGADAERGFPVISAEGERMACSALVPGPPVQRPVLLTSIATGEMRLVCEDCGGRPRQWLDERTLVIETFGAGLNAFLALDTRDGSQRPLLSSTTRRLSNPRVSPDRRWLAFDAATPGASPAVAVARLDSRATPRGDRVGLRRGFGQSSVLVPRRPRAVLPADDPERGHSQPYNGAAVRIRQAAALMARPSRF